MSAPSTPNNNDTPALPTQPITACPGPWLHEKVCDGTLDINAIARKLAELCCSGNAAKEAMFRQYFQKSLNFNRTSIQNMCDSLDTDSREAVLHVLGSSPTVPENTTNRVKAAALVGRAMLATVFADRLAYLADPSSPAERFTAQEFPLSAMFRKEMVRCLQPLLSVPY